MTFFDSAIGKAVRAIGYVMVSSALVALVPFLQNNPDVVGGVAVAGILIAGINGLLVFVKGWSDPNIPTLPR